MRARAEGVSWITLCPGPLLNGGTVFDLARSTGSHLSSRLQALTVNTTLLYAVHHHHESSPPHSDPERGCEDLLSPHIFTNIKAAGFSSRALKKQIVIKGNTIRHHMFELSKHTNI